MRRLLLPILFGLNLVVMLNFVAATNAQELELSWQMQPNLCDASLRGLCVVDEKVVWASGSGGTILKTKNGGESWKDVSLPGGKELDFRDIHAFDSKNAVVINAGQPALFYRTGDGGITWEKVFHHPNETAFFDSVAAIDSTHLIAMSDPIDDRILLVESTDSGESWTELEANRRPLKLAGEAGFAASGSNMITDPEAGTIYLALGSAEEGTKHKLSRIVYSTDAAQTWNPINCPMKRNPSSGIFSLSYLPNQRLVAVGGDYRKPEEKVGIISIAKFTGDTVQCDVPETTPGGFRSGVTFTRIGNEQILVVTVGTNGGDYSQDSGETWRPFSTENFHAVKSTGSGTIWASGGNGRIAKLLISEPPTWE